MYAAFINVLITSIAPLLIAALQVTKQTQKAKPLPPAPYYSIERADEWSVNSISAKRIDGGLRVLPESDADGCHILLQVGVIDLF